MTGRAPGLYFHADFNRDPYRDVRRGAPRNVTVGHRAIIHGCSIGNSSLVGMRATILDNAQIGEQCIIGAHALAVKGANIPARSLVMGIPAKVIRSLTDAEIQSLKASAESFQKLGAYY